MKTFEHKKDVVSMFGLIGIILTINLLRYINGYGFSIPVLMLTFFLAIMVIWMWKASSYTIDNQTLSIKNGPFTQKVDINEIEKIKSGVPSIFKGKMSSFQLTLVYRKNKKLNVYPIDKQDFIKSLKKGNSKIKVD